MSLSDSHTCITPNLPDADIQLYPNFLTPKFALNLFEVFKNKIPWRHDPVKVFGKTYMQPRLTSLHGTTKQSYGYSNLRMYPEPMTPEMLDLMTRIKPLNSTSFNIVLLNMYRDGNDSNGWHADNEKELGQNPVIASISLGASRIFKLKHRHDKNLTHQMLLENGSLLMMSGQTQHHWLHHIPKTKKQIGPRINLTFRKVLDSA